MLLGATGPQGSFQAEENFIKELIIEKRFAEAYNLLLREAPTQPATQFNLALCFYWVENYKEAISFWIKRWPNCLRRAVTVI